MRIKVRQIILFSLLLDNLYLPLDFGFDFRVNYIVYILYILYTILTNRRVLLNKNLILGSTLFILLSIITTIIKGSPTHLVLKQTALIYTSFLVAYILINDYSFSITNFFKDYINIIYFAAIVGLIQFVSQFFYFKWGADFSYLGFNMGAYVVEPGNRIQSWFLEPSFLTYAFMPVVILIIARIFQLTKLISPLKGLIILTVFLLSKSAIGYVGLLISIMILASYKYSFLHNPRNIIIITFLFSTVAFYIYKIPDVKFRVDDTIKLFFDKQVSGKDIDKINLSTYAFYSNYKIAKRSYLDNPLIGTGLGTYEFNYDKYLQKEIPQSNMRKYTKVNRSDANSMFLRLLSETGIIGTFLFLFLIFTLRIKDDYNKFQLQELTDLWLLNQGIFVLIIIRLLRQGHYTMMGFTVFLLIYYYIFKEFKSKKISKSI